MIKQIVGIVLFVVCLAAPLAYGQSTTFPTYFPTYITGLPNASTPISVESVIVLQGGVVKSTPAANVAAAVLTTADQLVTGGATVTTQTLTTGNVTIDCGSRQLQSITNGGNFTITAPANDSNCLLLVTNNGSAGTVTFSGFSVGSNTGDALTTTNTSKFTIFIWRIAGTSGYRIAAHQ